MKKFSFRAMLLIIGFISGVSFLIHCSGSSPVDTKAEEGAPSVSELQTTITELSARITVLESKNNFAENIKGAWTLTWEGMTATMTFSDDTLTCSGSGTSTLAPSHLIWTSAMIKICDGTTRNYEISDNFLIVKFPSVTSTSPGFSSNVVSFIISISDNKLMLFDDVSVLWSFTKQ